MRVPLKGNVSGYACNCGSQSGNETLRLLVDTVGNVIKVFTGGCSASSPETDLLNVQKIFRNCFYNLMGTIAKRSYTIFLLAGVDLWLAC